MTVRIPLHWLLTAPVDIGQCSNSFGPLAC